MRKHSAGHTDRNTKRRYTGLHILLEHWSDDINDQHEHCRNVFSDSNRLERVHRIRYRNVDNSSEPDSIGGERGNVRECASRDADCNTERRDRGSDIRLEYRSHHIDDQHEHGGNVHRDGNGHEGVHRNRFRDIDCRSESHGFCQ